MKTEERRVDCGETIITYYLTRKKVKNVNMRIKSDGAVLISASPDVPLYFIENFIRSKYDFIVRSIERLNGEDKMRSREPGEDVFWQEGSVFPYLGEQYTVRVHFGEEDRVCILGGELVVSTCDRENAAFVNMLVRNWLYNRTAELFKRLDSEVSAEFMRRYGIKPALIKMKNMKSRWGSCHISDGVIVMNTRLIYYPENSVRYVFIHEYAHFIVPDHSSRFYRVVEEFMPDHKYWAAKLK